MTAEDAVGYHDFKCAACGETAIPILRSEIQRKHFRHKVRRPDCDLSVILGLYDPSMIGNRLRLALDTGDDGSSGWKMQVGLPGHEFAGRGYLELTASSRSPNLEAVGSEGKLFDVVPARGTYRLSAPAETTSQAKAYLAQIDADGRGVALPTQRVAVFNCSSASPHWLRPYKQEAKLTRGRSYHLLWKESGREIVVPDVMEPVRLRANPRAPDVMHWAGDWHCYRVTLPVLETKVVNVWLKINTDFGTCEPRVRLSLLFPPGSQTDPQGSISVVATPQLFLSVTRAASSFGSVSLCAGRLSDRSESFNIPPTSTTVIELQLSTDSKTAVALGLSEAITDESWSPINRVKLVDPPAEPPEVTLQYGDERMPLFSIDGRQMLESFRERDGALQLHVPSHLVGTLRTRTAGHLRWQTNTAVAAQGDGLVDTGEFEAALKNASLDVSLCFLGLGDHVLLAAVPPPSACAPKRRFVRMNSLLRQCPYGGRRKLPATLIAHARVSKPAHVIRRTIHNDE